MSNPKPYGVNELREMFLSYFESKGHLRLPSFPLIPQNDPSLLLIPAGAILITSLVFNLLGDALRDALDPRLKD